VVGATVTFTVNGAMFFPNANGPSVTATTDAQGVAIPYPNVMASNVAGSYWVMASTPNGSTVFDLTVVPGGPASISVFSGSKQTVGAGLPFPDAWAVRVLDANGNPAPYAAVYFYANPQGPSVTFLGSNWAYVAADQNGLAVSPPITASLINGHDFGSAMVDTNVPPQNPLSAFFTYTITSAKK
jgi:hypothetical protein